MGGFGFGYSPIFSREADGFLPEAQAIFDAMDTAPSADLKGFINTLVGALIDDGNWDEMDALWVLATETAQGASINWKDPSGTKIVAVNAPTFTASQGYEGDAATSYLDTGWNPATDATKFLQTDASLGLYSRTDVQTAGLFDFGSFNGGNSVRTLVAPWISGTFEFSLLTTSIATSVQGAALGSFSAYKAAATTNRGEINGVATANVAVANSAIQSFDLYALALNNTGAAGNFTPRQLSMLFTGSSSVSASNLHTAFNAYMTSLGTNVV